MARGDAQDQHRRRAITRLTPAPIPEQRRLPCVAPSTTTFHTTRARGGEGHWTSILRYDSAEHLEAWMNAPERKALLSETREFIESEELMRLATAFPGWVPIDPLTGEGPPNWKTAMLVLLGLFPIVMLRETFLWTITIRSPAGNSWRALPLPPAARFLARRAARNLHKVHL